MGMANSLLPSHDAGVLKPEVIGGVTFQVIPCPDLQTYVLQANGSNLASHPNGYSLKELVSRLITLGALDHTHEPATYARQVARVLAQWDYITACGGMTQGRRAIEYYLGEASQ